MATHICSKNPIGRVVKVDATVAGKPPSTATLFECIDQGFSMSLLVRSTKTGFDVVVNSLDRTGNKLNMAPAGQAANVDDALSIKDAVCVFRVAIPPNTVKVVATSPNVVFCQVLSFQ